MKKITLVLIATLLVATGLLAFGGNRGGFREHRGMRFEKGEMPCNEGYGMMNGHRRGNFARRRHDRMGYIFSQLELSDKQLEQVDKIRTAFQGKRIELKGQLMKLQFDKRVAMRNHNYDKAKKIGDDILKLRKQMQDEAIDHRKNLWNILTAKQKAKADKLMKTRHFRRFGEDLPDNE